MRNKLKSILLIATGALTLSACDPGDFGDTNVDPNNPTVVLPSALFANSITEMRDIVENTKTSLYVQHLSNTQYPEESYYGAARYSFDSFYYGPLKDLQEIIDSEAVNQNQKAAATILKAYIYQFMADRWGPVPFREALAGEQNFSPAYESQEAIYLGILKDLSESVDNLDEAAGSIDGDMFFDGKIASWAKLANSLIMNASMRISDTNQKDMAKTYFEAAVKSEFGYIDNILDNVKFPYISTVGFRSFYFEDNLKRKDYSPSKTLIDHLISTNDPRVSKFASLPTAGDTYIGWGYGLSDEQTIALDKTKISLFGASLTEPDFGIPLFTAAQSNFLLAEAVADGWISGDAKMYYDRAISLSMEQWGVTDSDAINTFISSDDVMWDASKATQLIGEQKWVALYTQGVEAWSEWRRLDYPMLTPTPNATNNGAIPVRHQYGNKEISNNADAYNAGVKLLVNGDDLDNTRVWWDKK